MISEDVCVCLYVRTCTCMGVYVSVHVDVHVYLNCMSLCVHVFAYMCVASEQENSDRQVNKSSSERLFKDKRFRFDLGSDGETLNTFNPGMCT